MGLKLSMLAAATAIALPMAAGAQTSYGSSAAPNAEAQTDAQEGQTPAQAATKKKSTAKSTGAKAAPKAEVETYSRDGLSPAQAASKKSAHGAKADADAKADAKAGGASASADIKAGASVYDSQGNAVGKIESVDGKAAVLNTGNVKVKVPLSGLTRNDKGLMIGMTASEIEAAAKAK